MSWFSKLKKVVAAPVRAGLAPLKLTRDIARSPLSIKRHLRAGVAAGLAPLAVARATTASSLRLSPHALIAQKLRRHAKAAPATPIGQGGSKVGFRRVGAAVGPWAGAPDSRASYGGGGGGGSAGAYDEDEDEDTSYDDGGDDGYDAGADSGADDDGMSGIDYGAYLGRDGLAGFTDDLERIGVNLAKGAASGLLSSAAGSLQNKAPAPPPPPKGMSGTAKAAIAAGVGIGAVFLLTRKRRPAAAVAT